jgi:Poly(R)-hydroxyalkanoic acid synthase subunit (PHA_synth_III_E)
MTDAANAKGGGAATAGTDDVFTVISEQIVQSWTASWASSYEMWSAMAASWQSLLNNRGAPAAHAVLDRMVKPSTWTEGLAPLFDELQQILALPQFSDLATFDPKALPSLAPAAELLAIANQFILAMVPVWARACQRFQAEAAERRRADARALDGAGEALDVWNNVLDQTLMEFNRSAEFAGLQQRLLRAAMGQRQEARKFGERIAQAVDLPTRTELDDVYRRLHDLLREVHYLRRELRLLKRDAAPRVKPKALIRPGAGA